MNGGRQVEMSRRLPCRPRPRRTRAVRAERRGMDSRRVHLYRRGACLRERNRSRSRDRMRPSNSVLYWRRRAHYQSVRVANEHRPPLPARLHWRSREGSEGEDVHPSERRTGSSGERGLGSANLALPSPSGKRRSRSRYGPRGRLRLVGCGPRGRLRLGGCGPRGGLRLVELRGEGAAEVGHRRRVKERSGVDLLHRLLERSRDDILHRLNERGGFDALHGSLTVAGSSAEEVADVLVHLLPPLHMGPHLRLLVRSLPPSAELSTSLGKRWERRGLRDDRRRKEVGLV